jgi:hypothetical protein
VIYRSPQKDPNSPKVYATSFILPVDLKASIQRACRRQGCSMTFKIVDILKAWEAKFLENERQNGRGKVSE